MTTFTNYNTQYTMTVYNRRSHYEIVIREADTGLFVKRITPLTKQKAAWYTSKAMEGRRILFDVDLNTMRVLDYIELYLANNGKVPLVREITMATRVPVGEVSRLIKCLSRLGFLEREHYKERGYRVLRRRVDA